MKTGRLTFLFVLAAVLSVLATGHLPDLPFTSQPGLGKQPLPDMTAEVRDALNREWSGRPPQQIAGQAAAPALPDAAQEDPVVADGKEDLPATSAPAADAAPAMATAATPPEAVAEATPEATITEVPAESEPAPAAQQANSTPIDLFRQKLRDLANGKRREPVVILHLGDSHIAADSFTRGIRQHLQTRFGNAGRGAVIPAGAFKYASADQVDLKLSGPWTSAMSLKSGNGIFGVSGVRVESSSSASFMTLKADATFDYADITAVVGPGQGSAIVSVDGAEQTISTKSATSGTRSFRISRGGSTLAIRPAGDGRISLLNWSTARNAPGIRYINFGQIGATVSVTKRWNAQAVSTDIKAIKPDLIVYGFGTNEGFDDNINPAAYRAYARQFLSGLHADAPGAALAVIGAADGLRHGRGTSCGNGWAQPKNLPRLRETMQGLAAEMGAFYWDWGKAMGGACSINNWARNGMAAPDRIHLTAKGYDTSAESFYRALIGPLANTTDTLASAR